MPAVTVVTPVFNVGAVFADTATSLLRQTLQQFEWVIVNDGSDGPETLEVLSNYRNLDPRVRVIDHAENRGLSAARNTGFEQARSAFVMMLDGDDMLEPTALEKLVWFLWTRPELAFAKGYTVGFGAESYVWVNGFHHGRDFLETNLADSHAMVRHSVHRAVGGFDETNRGGLEDWDFWLKCANAGYWGDTVHEPLSWYRRREGHGLRWAKWDGGEAQAHFKSGLRLKYPRLWEGDFPDLPNESEQGHQSVEFALPFTNALTRGPSRAILLISPSLTNDFGLAQIDLARALRERGWQLTLLLAFGADERWGRNLASISDDVHVLPRFLRKADYPRFVDYIAGSRRPRFVLFNEGRFGYELLPYLRARHPEAVLIDLVYSDKGSSADGWSVAGAKRDLLDLSVVGSARISRSLANEGVDALRVQVCRLGVPAQAMGEEFSRLLHLAEELHKDAPRLIPSLESAQAQAVRAVVDPEALHDNGLQSSRGEAEGHTDGNWILYRLVSAIAGPVYRVFKRSGAGWVITLRDRFRRRMKVHPLDIPWDETTSQSDPGLE